MDPCRAADASERTGHRTTSAYQPGGRRGGRGSGLQGRTSATHQLQHQATAEIKPQLETLGVRSSRRAQCSEIDKLVSRHHRAPANRGLRTTTAVESAPPPVEARGADSLLRAECAYAQAAIGKLRQQLAPDIRTQPPSLDPLHL